jgi:light-regulated signal transduction histidine kinase (bacteriophytochrome)
LSGKDRCVLHNSFIVEDAETGVESIQVICMDATELRDTKARLHELNLNLEERVVRRTAELEAANSELRAFAYSVSHDLRAPLRAIDGFSYALLEECGSGLRGEGRRYLKRIRRGCQTMSQLIDALLRLSRLSFRQLDYRSVNVSSLAEKEMERLRASAPDRQCDCEIAPGMIVDGDQVLLEVLVQNLLGNAWKFSASRPVARIEMGLRREQGRPAFFVADNGIGFDPAYRSKLFRTFERLHGAEEYEGTGVGLATVKRIVERHGGRVWAEGAEGEGATVFFTLAP